MLAERWAIGAETPRCPLLRAYQLTIQSRDEVILLLSLSPQPPDTLPLLLPNFFLYIAILFRKYISKTTE